MPTGCYQPVRTAETMVNEIKLMKQVLKNEDLECYDVVPDGNCLFASVVDQLRIRGIFHFTVDGLREVTVAYLRENPFSVSN